MKIEKAIYERYVRGYAPGETIFEEGKSGDLMYVIVEGEVEIRKRTSRTATKTLAVFHAGDIFGEMALIEKKPRSATAITTRQSKLLAMNDNLLEAMIESNPDFARKMIRMLAERLRKSNAIIQTITTNNRQEQVLSGLHRFAREQGQAIARSRLNPSAWWNVAVIHAQSVHFRVDLLYPRWTLEVLGDKPEMAVAHHCVRVADLRTPIGRISVTKGLASPDFGIVVLQLGTEDSAGG